MSLQVPGRRCVAIVLLTLITLTILSVLISWIAIKPKRLIYKVETASIENFTLSKNHLNAIFDLVIRAYNPNSKVSIYYDSMKVSADLKDQTIASGAVKPFFQPHQNVTLFDASLSSRNVTLFDQVSKDLALKQNSGKIGLDVWIEARIRFKVGLWKSRDRTLRVSCSPVTVQISKSKSFNRTDCSVKL